MERDYKFTAGQKVRTKDEESGEPVNGIVTDYSSVSVFIQWEDLSEPSEHFQNEYENIKLR